MKTDEPRKPNRLIREKSPYLLQHAYNPVEWYPWGEEALARAKKENRPIFLSIGYSTCHWCHVMEKESFEDPEVAKLMNGHFVSIKVDREERPDIDHVYMAFVMATSGSGGWPLNVFLTPEGKPFFGGTYFPPKEVWGRPSFTTVLLQIADTWKEKQKEILESGDSIAEALKENLDRSHEKSAALSETLFQKGASQYVVQYDATYGGFGSAPKFPRSHALSFLLRYWKRSGDAKALEMVEKTLTEMAKGGLYDHLGGGFHRYSTDGQWRIPHFEKMLYDQALLSRSYLEAYQATHKGEYATVAREIFDYVLRDLESPEGAFYSAEDADSASDPKYPDDKHEGAFYLWKKGEILKILGKEGGEKFSSDYGIEEDGNALSDPQGEFVDQNVLYEAHPAQANVPASEWKKKLFTEREKRPRPHLDDKILVDWNGLMISSLAYGSRVLEDSQSLKAAQKAADFILRSLVRKDGRLLHRYREGEAALLGTLDDHAFLIQGLLDLYEATFEVRYLEEAKRLTFQMIDLFWDEAQGGFFMTGVDAEALLFRPKELYDGAIPSGNSVAVLDCLRMERFTMDKSLEEKVKRFFEGFSSQIVQMPMHYPQTLIALDFAFGPSEEIVLAGDRSDPKIEMMARLIYSRFLPNRIVVFHPEGEEGKKIESLVPFAAQ